MSDPLPPIPPAVPPSPGSPPPVALNLNESQWALVIHLSALLGFFMPGILSIGGPLLVWLFKRPESLRLDAVGKRVLNFQISYAIYFYLLSTIAAVLTYVLIGLLIWPFVGILALAWLVLTLYGAIKESNDEPFAYPFVIHLLK